MVFETTASTIPPPRPAEEKDTLFRLTSHLTQARGLPNFVVLTFESLAGDVGNLEIAHALSWFPLEFYEMQIFKHFSSCVMIL